MDILEVKGIHGSVCIVSGRVFCFVAVSVQHDKNRKNPLD